ncbi:Golgi CORVET complex core vacuolar protein 8-domain-containing protein [Fomitopsis serialis]|uniref:Golgi CORVET complex core vacuolar protein 8-domain-containing protein n=1 Tax=Fomitopsis serialis TaxID=139415 RepID=UPI002008B13B|nr:Golgi CORVET complex core vacuolar protein 8-domain-containing protein [Neoantrodia serialis]KAH9935787.1 Golgi CORVET complex core vacuolar protein 8-domain-containing protein [Neoantrodia serialis]
MNGTRRHDDLDFSDGEDGDVQDDHPGDYSARLEELMSDTEEGSDGHPHDDEHGDEDDEEGFVYSGMDAVPSGGYREQLRDVLGHDHEEDELDEREVERSLVHDVEEKDHLASLMEDEARPVGPVSDDTPSTPPTPPISVSGAPSPPKPPASNGRGTPSRLSRPFLHPTISRLRSTTPQASRVPSSASVGTLFSHVPEGVSESPSHFSALSRSSSATNAMVRMARAVSHPRRERSSGGRNAGCPRRPLAKQPQKAASLLGTENAGSPTVMAANGLICVGTDVGKVVVFDFKQNLKCICGTDDKAAGPVTAVALSFDHTFVATGHANGHIQLFDLNTPKTPARFVPPTTLAEVAAGRQEGHIAGSRIVSVGFVAGRHTAIVSADDSGLSFYHSLGKVFFMDASDTLRLLGKYPEDSLGPGPSGPNGVHHFRRRKSRKGNSLLAMAPLPLGTASHPTDQYNLIALLTPIKLVSTWYRRHREDDDISSRSRFKGTLAWYPSIVRGKKDQAKGIGPHASTTPALVYSWAETLHMVRVSETKVPQQVRNPRTGKVTTTEVGRVTFEEAGHWTASGDILALQWLNVNQVVVLTSETLEVYDVRSHKLVEQTPFDARSLVSPILGHTINSSVSYPDAVMEVSHSVRVYKGKIFTLGQHEVRVGTLLTWADRILSFVQHGDFLSAIELTRAYYVGESPGNRNGLPESTDQLKEVVGEKMHELMVASARYAFSEDRMTDGTLAGLDGRGVDNFLFEGLVRVCIRACMALDDYDFLYEDLFQDYDDTGIARIFLSQLEPFIIDGNLHYVPPRITQRLVAIHDDDGRPDLVERIIWHIDPECLDVNQAITLCQRHQLYDALLYVFTRAMKDHVSPLVELLGLIRRVQQYRRAREEGLSLGSYPDDDAIEPVVLNAYKVYPYLGNVLTGLAYPSANLYPTKRPTKQDTTLRFLYVRSIACVATARWKAWAEATYPYARLLLRFDPEAFLHTLDLAFEDGYLSDPDSPRGTIRLLIVKILLDITSSGDLTQDAVTFVNIFIARNVPKYPQFLQMPPTTLHNILIGTQEDRQLAAEHLLSDYTPHETNRIIALFEKAGFYRILRSWYRQERKWSPLLLTYVHDSNLSNPEVFDSLSDVLTLVKRLHKGALPPDILTTMTDCLPLLLERGVVQTAADMFPARKGGPSSHVSSDLRRTYLSLHCRLDPAGVVAALRYLPVELLDAEDAVRVCEEHAIYDASFGNQLSARLADSLVQYDPTSEATVQETLAALDAVGQRAVTMCLEHSQSSEDVPLEDIWYHLLKSQIDTVQHVAYELQQTTLSVLRKSMQGAFTALMSVSSAKGVSLPRLFKRLLTTASHNAVSKPTLYAEFRTLFTGMLESYRSDGDMLIITKHLVDRDLSTTIEELTRERMQGWAPSQGRCQTCKEWLVDSKTSSAAEQDNRTGVSIVVSRTGALYHQSCLPPTHQDNIAVH